MTTKARGPLMEDYTRALKAAKREGWREVSVNFPGGYEIVLREGAGPAPAMATPLEEERSGLKKLSWHAAEPEGEQATDVIRALLKKGPARTPQIRAELERHGYSPASVGTVLHTLTGQLVKIRRGVYALSDEAQTEAP
jgi:hypothetical protein